MANICRGLRKIFFFSPVLKSPTHIGFIGVKKNGSKISHLGTFNAGCKIRKFLLLRLRRNCTQYSSIYIPQQRTAHCFIRSLQKSNLGIRQMCLDFQYKRTMTYNLQPRSKVCFNMCINNAQIKKGTLNDFFFNFHLPYMCSAVHCAVFIFELVNIYVR